MPIFNRGQIKGRYKSAKADFEQVIAQYNGAVVDAAADVAKTLSRLQGAHKQLMLQSEHTLMNEKELHLISQRYVVGVDSYSVLLEQGIKSLQASSEFIQKLSDHRITCVDLFRSLGGGFNLNEEK